MGFNSYDQLARVTMRWLIIVFVAATLFSTAKIYPQIAGTGSIQGTIADPTGGVIPNASVVVVNTATGVQHKATTDANGLYSFPNISIGTYTLEVSAAGFRQYTQEGIVLEVGSSIGKNVHMVVGATNQKVEVQANGLALQTEDASFKQTIDEKTLTELPLNGREVSSLITLSGGAATAPSFVLGSKTFFSSVAVSIAGGMGTGTDYRLDGGDNNDYMADTNLPFPFPDAVNQFSVETAALGAQSGTHSGGLVNVVTRSGSNQWHGTEFEFIRNNIIDATNFFSATKDSLHQNEYGGTLGGKIIRDKLFFFGGYQHLKADQSQSLSQAYIPTPANLSGDFSGTDGTTCVAGGKSTQLLNPLTGNKLPNNQISTSYFSAPALALYKYFPKTSDPCGLVFYAVPNETSENQIITRVDDTLNQKNSLYARYFLDGYTTPAFFSPTNVLTTTSSGLYERAQTLTLGWTHVFNSNTINSFYATATRRRVDRGGSPANNIGPATIGINMYAPYAGFLGVVANTKWQVGYGAGPPAEFNVNTFPFADDMTLIRGKHQLAFGGSFARSQVNINNPFQQNGLFTFSGIFSELGPGGNSPGGSGEDANLDFLTGALNAISQSKPQQNALRAPIMSLYFHDIYHVTSNLVLSAGVRWEPNFMPVDYFHRGSVFSDADFLDNVHSRVFPNAPAGSLYYGDTGVPAAFTQNTPWQFAPNFGITYDPTGRGTTVLRAGSSVAYNLPDFFLAELLNQNPPYATDITNVPVGVPLNFASPWSNGTVPSDPFPLPFIPSSNTTFPKGAQYIVIDPHFRPMNALQWTASVQHELSRGWQVQIDYIGTRTNSGSYGLPLNPAVYIPGTCGSGPCSTIGNTASRFALNLANPSQGPYYGGGTFGLAMIHSGIHASYNGMIATIQHRVSSNFSFLANYTWSHCIDINDDLGVVGAASVEDPNNIQLDRGNCGFDYRDIFNATIVATSRFPLTGWTGRIINNWELAPLIHARDGTPFTVYSGQDNSLTDGGADRPNLIHPNNVYTGKAITKTNAGNRYWINASAFAQNATGTYGNVGRNEFRGPKFFQMDAELSRFFSINQKFTLDTRLESFNVLNHPNFSTPNPILSSPSFGQISSTTSYGARIFQGGLKLIF